jgi:hypothetical protein
MMGLVPFHMLVYFNADDLPFIAAAPFVCFFTSNAIFFLTVICT